MSSGDPRTSTASAAAPPGTGVLTLLELFALALVEECPVPAHNDLFHIFRDAISHVRVLPVQRVINAYALQLGESIKERRRSFLEERSFGRAEWIGAKSRGMRNGQQADKVMPFAEVLPCLSA
jgi:hypothetical protein